MIKTTFATDGSIIHINQNFDMRNRIEILKELVLLQGNIASLKKELSQYSWDIEESLFTVKIGDIINVLKRCLDNEFDFENHVRRIIRLPERPYDLYHRK